MKNFSSASSAYLTPMADGHYDRSYFCCPESCGGCIYDYEIITDGIAVLHYTDTFRCFGSCSGIGDSLDLRIGILEFDVAGLSELFTRGQLQAHLYLTIKDGNLPVDSCLTLYSIQDENENGIIQVEDISTMEYVGEACANFQHEDTISFYVTSAVEHDLFDPDQANFSGFIIEGFDWIEFYDHTDSVNAPQLSIVASDFDNDSIPDYQDNCPETPNPDQLDTYPPQGNDIGDACDCEGNFDCDEDCDGTDAATFKGDFGRNPLYFPCDEFSNFCQGDFDCDHDVDGSDASIFKVDFGRSSFNDPCPACVVGEWCEY